MSDEKEKIDRFTELMFGSAPRKKDGKENTEEAAAPLEQSSPDEVNYFQLMSQIDDIMGSWENLKPMIKEFSPVVSFFKKKK
ncbi:hypothetical protein ACFFIX_11090 [Metabacillus herbersteinensis]|uniref:Uncharacterized protein n=1 Tax=Metabacillus herbersteinensis TaxID=283816 RepID=A0ABV6GE85_9BACI